MTRLNVDEKLVEDMLYTSFKEEALIRELAGALEELICCGVFTGALIEKDKKAHRAWTLGRGALEHARKHLGVSVINSEFDKKV